MFHVWSGLIHHQGKSQTRPAQGICHWLTWRQAIGPDASLACHVGAEDASNGSRPAPSVKRLIIINAPPPGGNTEEFASICPIRSRLPYGSNKGNLAGRSARNLPALRFHCPTRFFLLFLFRKPTLNLLFFLPLDWMLCVFPSRGGIQAGGGAKVEKTKKGWAGAQWRGIPWQGIPSVPSPIQFLSISGHSSPAAVTSSAGRKFPLLSLRRTT